MVYLTRRERFNAAHKLWVASWSPEQNKAAFGPCANENWHGHNYELFVTIKGQPDPTTGFLMNVKDLSSLIRERLIRHLDHRNLNLDVPFIQANEPTTIERLVVLFWEQLEDGLPENCALHAIRLVETENIYAEYFGG